MTLRLIAVVAVAAALASGCGGGSSGSSSGVWTALGPEGGTVLSLAVDPSDSETVYAGGYGGVFQSTDSRGHWTLGGTGAGREILAIAVDPSEPRTLYAGSGSGVLKSTDGGATWGGAGQGTEEASVTALAIDPDAPGTVYAGTGNALFEIFGDALPGVLKSTDGGESWQPSNEGVSSEPGDMIFGGGGYPAINVLAIDPDNHDTLFAGTTDGVFRTEDAGAHWRATGLGESVYDIAADRSGTLYATTDSGIRRSTDGGTTWEKRGRVEGAFRLVIDPDAPDTLYASTNSGVSKSVDGGVTWMEAGLAGMAVPALATASDGALYAATLDRGVLTSEDAGETWQSANSGPTAVVGLSIALDPKSPRSLLLGSFFNGIQRSEDGGMTWHDSGKGLGSLGRPAYVTELLFDPAQPGRIYAGGDRVYRSDDGGESWQQLDELYAGNVAALAFGSADARVLLAAADDQLLSTSDSGETWQEVGGGVSSNFTALTVDPVNPHTLYAGTEDGIEKSIDGGGSWQPARMGMACDGSGSRAKCAAVHAIVVDPAATQVVYAATEEGLFITSDAAASWQPAGEGLPEGVPILSLSIDPRSSATVYAGTADGTFRSDDRGQTWVALDGLAGIAVTGLALDADSSTLYAATFAGTYSRKVDAPSGGTAPPPQETEAAPAPGPVVSLLAVSVFAVAVDPARPEMIYAGTSNGVVRSADGGRTWRKAGLDGELIDEIVVDPKRPQRLFASSSGGGDLFRSTDGGASWMLQITCGRCEHQSLSQVAAVAIDPKRPQTAYAGMYGGLAKSSDGGTIWAPSDRGLPDSPGIHALAVDPRHPDVVYAGGNDGLWRSSDGGSTWQRERLDVGPQPYVGAMAVDPASPETVYVAAQFDLVKTTDGGRTWRTLRIRGDAGGSREAIAIDPARPRRLFVAVADAAVGGRGLLFESRNGGRTWARVKQAGRKEINALAVAPRTGTLYAGAQDAGVLVIGRQR